MDDLLREMITPPRTGLDRPRRARLVVTALTLGLAAAGVTSLTTSALFTDTEAISGTEFITGTVQISPALAQSVTFDADNLAPGDTAYGAVTVDNTGSLEQRYAIRSVGTNAGAVDLAGLLALSVYDVPPADCDAAGVAAATPLGAVPGVATTSTALVGDVATGAQAGDRTLAALTQETLCVVVHLPASTDNTFQGATAAVDLVFLAEQTVNN